MTLFELEHTFSVAELGQLISEVLTVTFPTDVWVQGEVRSMRRPSSGHVYFDLVDPSSEPGRSPDAVLSVVLFKGTRDVVNAQIKRSGGGMRIDDGISIRLRAAPDFYPPHGRLQIRMTGIDPTYTLGQLSASRERLLQTLASEGLLEANRAIPLGIVPLRVGLVTAAGSAAQADFLHELAGSGFGFDVVMAATAVQGPGAAAQVAAAISACGERGVDVIAVVRGGGARTDLVAFDDEAVARAIAAAPVPVLTGIGHEIDTAVADVVAHLALKTPTACAAMLVGRVREAERRTVDAWAGISAAAVQRLAHEDRRVVVAAGWISDRARARLRAAHARTGVDARRARELVGAQLARGEHRLARHGQRVSLTARHRTRLAGATLERHQQALGRVGRKGLDGAEARLANAEIRARLLDPARALAKGWSITTNDGGVVVRSVRDVSPGQALRTRVADGAVVSTVAGVETARNDERKDSA